MGWDQHQTGRVLIHKGRCVLGGFGKMWAALECPERAVTKI